MACLLAYLERQQKFAQRPAICATSNRGKTGYRAVNQLHPSSGRAHSTNPKAGVPTAGTSRAENQVGGPRHEFAHPAILEPEAGSGINDFMRCGNSTDPDDLAQIDLDPPSLVQHPQGTCGVLDINIRLGFGRREKRNRGDVTEQLTTTGPWGNCGRPVQPDRLNLPDIVSQIADRDATEPRNVGYPLANVEPCRRG